MKTLPIKLDLTIQEAHQTDLDDALAKMAAIKRDIEYHRLQLKQAKAKAREAKTHPLVAELVGKLLPLDPALKVTPSPGGIYISASLTPIQYRDHGDLPAQLGMYHSDSYTLHTTKHGSPIQHTHCKDGVILCLTQFVI